MEDPTIGAPQLLGGSWDLVSKVILHVRLPYV